MSAQSLSLDSSDPIYGTTLCQKCNKYGAYWKTRNGYFCGVHSRNVEKIELKKDPKAVKEKKEKSNELRKQKIEECRNKDGNGKVIMTKMAMMKEPDYKEGYVAIFPNKNHGNRSDGIGMTTLSPMNLGPVNHVMKEYPPAKNLENYWQFSKVSVDMIGKEKELYSIRCSGYNDEVGHRHGYIEDKNTRISHSEFISKNGEVKKYSYVQARFFYCYYYEKLVEKNQELEKLRELIKAGYNIQIFGYDAFYVNNRSMEEHYLDESKPFGHEAVIYTMLTETEYPWNKFKELYKDMI